MEGEGGSEIGLDDRELVLAGARSVFFLFFYLYCAFSS